MNTSFISNLADRAGMLLGFFIRYRRLIGACVIAVLLISAEQQIRQMDERFFQLSWNGVRGLAYYLLGNYSGSAKAYRAQLRDEFLAGESSTGDEAYDELIKGNLDAARKLSKGKLGEQPENISALLTLGEIAIEENAFEDARNLLAKILQQKPDHADALLLLAVTQSHLGHHGDAIDTLKRILRDFSQGRRITPFLHSLQTTGQLEEHADRDRAWCLLAHYYRYLRIYDPSTARLAVASAKKAIAMGDRADDGYVTLGVIADKEDDEDEALAEFLHASTINTKNAEAHRWAANIYRRRGSELPNEYRERRDAFLAAPDDAFYRDIYFQFLQQSLGDYPQALSVAKGGLERWPEDAKWFEYAGDMLQELGEHEQAIEYLTRGLKIKPASAEFHGRIGTSFFELSRLDEAIAAYRKAIAIAPSQSYLHANLASAYSLQHRRQEAIAEYEIALQLGTQDMDAHLALCELYHFSSRYAQAEFCLTQLLSKDPHNKPAKRLLSYTRRNLRRE